MKINNSIRRCFDAQLGLNEVVARRVEDLFTSRKQAGWFYYGRVKQLESFAQKVETGRGDPSNLDDFFACTLVVENRTAISEAVAMVEELCLIRYRKPKVAGETHKSPDQFPFDDLRLYVTLRQNEALEPSPLTQVVFEVQVKTFLQHAWGIATHDLIYKGDSVDWGRSRVAYQIKAMLEHAEISIAEVATISRADTLSVTDKETRHANQLLEWLREKWDEEQLPSDRIRLVRTLNKLLEALKLSPEHLISAVAHDTAAGFGTHLRNLSPYGIAIRALFNHRRQAVNRFLGQQYVPGSVRILLTEEMEIGPLPDGARPERFIRLEAPTPGVEVEVIAEETAEHDSAAAEDDAATEPSGIISELDG